MPCVAVSSSRARHRCLRRNGGRECHLSSAFDPGRKGKGHKRKTPVLFAHKRLTSSKNLHVVTARSDFSGILPDQTTMMEESPMSMITNRYQPACISSWHPLLCLTCLLATM